MLMKKESNIKQPRFNRSVCVACTMCADICPVGAIEWVTHVGQHGSRRYPALMNPGLCIGCGSCKTECPMGAIG